MTGRAGAAGQPSMLFAHRNWQGIKKRPCSRKKLLLVKPPNPNLNPSVPSLWMVERKKGGRGERERER